MARSAYKSDIAISFINDDEETKIAPQFVKYIVIENTYESKPMPVIYISLAVTKELHGKILQNTKTAKIYLSIQKYNANSDLSMKMNSIVGQFTYIPSTGNPNYAESLEIDSIDNAYSVINLALISMELLNKAKTSFNGTFGEIDGNTLLVNALAGLKSVVKMPAYNPVFDTINIPPLNTRTKLIEFIFNKCPFYDTNYIFFMDFDYTYLLDLTGEFCDAGDDSPGSVYIDIQKVTDDPSYFEGMEIKDGAYYIHVNPANTNISPNQGINKVANQMVFVDEDEVQFVDLEINNNFDSETKQAFNRGLAASLYKNIAESNTVIIELVKENIDPSAITPNKEFIVKNIPEYSDYDGKYTLLYKKEVIKNVHGEFGISVSIGLRKVGNIKAIGMGVIKSIMNKSKSVVGKIKESTSKTYSSTNNMSNTGLKAGAAKASYSNKMNLTMFSEPDGKPVYVPAINPEKSKIAAPTIKRVSAKSGATLKRVPKKETLE